MQHGTCRVEKIKSFKGLAERFGHNDRSRGELLNVDPSKTPENEFLIGSEDVKKVLEAGEKRLKLVTGKIKKDQILGNEVLLTLTSDALEKNGGCMTPAKVEEYLKKGHEFILKRFGKANVISAIKHLDEGVPHIQYLIMGVHEVTKKVRKVVSVDAFGKKTFEDTDEKRTKFVLNSQDFWGSSGKMSQFQSEFYEGVSKEFGLQRGQQVEKLKHERSNLGIALARRETDLKFREEIVDQKMDVYKAKIQVFEDDYAKFIDEKNALDNEKGLIKKQLLDLEKREKQVLKSVGVTPAEVERLAENDKILEAWRNRSPDELRKLAHDYDVLGAKNSYEAVEKNNELTKKLEKQAETKGVKKPEGKAR